MRNLLGYLIPLLAFGIWYWIYRVPPQIDEREIHVVHEGATVALRNLENGPLLLNFYASWCGHCLEEMESLNQAHQLGVFTVVGITDDGDAKIAAIRERFGVTYPIYTLDKSLNDYGIRTLPTTYLIGADGTMLYRATGTKEFHSEKFMNKARSLLSITPTN
jgi:thiol-disulfide isomerase/thioredoxin